MKITLLNFCQKIILLFFLFAMPSGIAQTCDYVAGDISFNATGGNTSTDYTNVYLLVNNATGIISQRSTTTNFNNVSAGNYDIYNVNYETATSGGEGFSVTGIMVGDNISGIGGTCHDLSAPLNVEVCQLNIEWVNQTAAGSEVVTAYQPTLTISGGDISGVTMTTTIEVNLSGTATAGADYFPNTSLVTLTIPKGDYSTPTTLNFNDLTTDDFSIIDDMLQEMDETVIFTLQNPTGMTIGNVDGTNGVEDVHTYTIMDNDVLLVEWVNTTASALEAAGNNLPSLTISGAEITSAATVEVTLGGTATAGVDFSPSSTITVTIPARNYQTTPLIQGLNDFNLSTADLSITDDQAIEMNETIVLTLQNPMGITIGDVDNADGTESVHTYTILDDDGLLIEFANGSASGMESANENLPQLNISGGVISSPVTIDVALIVGGSATVGADFGLANGSFPIQLTIPAGDYTNLTTIDLNDLTMTQDLSIIDDVLVEPSETFTLELQNPVGVSISDADGTDGVEAQFVYTILDDDCASAARTLSK